VWKPIPVFENNYEVSSFGRLRRALNAPYSKATKQGRIITGHLDNGGYLRTCIRVDGKAAKHQIHRLVAMAFVGGYDKCRQINHIDGNKINNRPENLEWVSSRENVLHAWRTGLCTPSCQGTKHWKHILSELDVKAILYLLANGIKGRLLANAFGLQEASISSIKRGKAWKHINK
jgi:hypothetical protein